jgi:integrase
MQQPTLRNRVRNGKTVYYCQLNGKQHGLGDDFKAAKKRYGELLADWKPKDGSPNSTVANLIDQFLAWCGDINNCESSTCDGYTRYLTSFKSSIGTRLRVRDLKKHHLTSWLNANFKGSRVNTRNKAISYAKRALNWAIEEDLLDTSPIANYKMQPAEHRELVISETQWAELLKLLENKNGNNFDDFKDYLTILWATGCRPQEARLIEAQWFDRKFKRWVFPVKKSKGKKRRRIVYLTDEAFAICERLALKHPTGPLFTRANGKAWDKNTVRCKFRRLKLRLGIPELCAYTLRHSWATRQLEAGKPTFVVSTLLGHSSTRMLESRYGHIDQNPEFLLSELTRQGRKVG